MSSKNYLSHNCFKLIACKKENELENTNCSEVSASYNNDIEPMLQIYCQNYGCQYCGRFKGI
jgi:hypothetical protein